MRLFHFSDDPAIAMFKPRPVLVPSPRPPGKEWLNGPLVWAIDDWHQPMYLFPRDCPRILIWPLATTTMKDRRAHWGECGHRMIAYVETGWLDTIRSARLTRYEFATDAFESLDDAGMWVAREAVTPIAVETIDDLPAALIACDVELRPMESLVPLKSIWTTSLHASGIRLRNARGWS